jgi:hypothetical protein
MKTSKNLLKGIERSYTMAFMPIILIYAFVVLVFASANSINIQIYKDVNSIKQRNYPEFIGNTKQDKKNNSTVTQQNDNTVNSDSVTAIDKPTITSTIDKTPLMNIEAVK